MASWSEWSKCGFDERENKSTTERYAEIKNLGFPTVRWKEFKPKSEAEIKKMLESVEVFLGRNKPCLFIFESKNFPKGYLFNVVEMQEINDWVSSQSDLSGFTFLITTQISPIREGFIGTAISDGKGNLFCETVHDPNVSNHRSLSQGKFLGEFHDFFVAEDGEVIAAGGKFLRRRNFRELIEMFAFRKGEFEFTCGEMSGEVGIFVTGYESKVNYPAELGKSIYLDSRARLNSLE